MICVQHYTLFSLIFLALSAFGVTYGWQLQTSIMMFCTALKRKDYLSQPTAFTSFVVSLCSCLVSRPALTPLLVGGITILSAQRVIEAQTSCGKLDSCKTLSLLQSNLRYFKNLSFNVCNVFMQDIAPMSINYYQLLTDCTRRRLWLGHRQYLWPAVDRNCSSSSRMPLNWRT